MAGEKVPEIKIGTVPQSSYMNKIGFKTGDVIRGINGKSVYNLADIPMGTSDRITSITVERYKNDKKISLNENREKFFKD